MMTRLLTNTWDYNINKGMTTVIKKKIPQVRKDLREKLVNQALSEIENARTHQSKRHVSWKEIENEVLAKRRINTDTSRSNVKLFQMREFLDTLISKIDAPMDFEFSAGTNKAKEAQARNLNALKDRDKQPQHGNWAMKDYLAKQMAAIYGRVVYEMHAESKGGEYKNILTLVDVYDFFIDENVSPVDIETAEHMGRYGIKKSLAQLIQGKKDGIFIRDEVNRIVSEGSYTEGDKISSTQTSQSDLAKNNRQNAVASKTETAVDYMTFWEWYTTWNGQRYYLLMNEQGVCLRAHKLTDVFSSGLYPFATWAYYPDAFEFWTPSPCEVIRDVVILQEKNVNQIMDNVEAINKPQKAVVSKFIENMTDLKYRRNGIIRLKTDGNQNINNVFQTVSPNEVRTPLEVYNFMNTIVQRVTGVNDASQGITDEGGKVGIFEGNLSAAADRFARIEKSYSDAYSRLALLYYWGVRDHLTKKTAIEVQGETGVETIEVTRKNIGDEPFNIVIKSSIVQINKDRAVQRRKLEFLQTNGQRFPNTMKALEIEAEIIGFSTDEVTLLMMDDYGSSQIIAEASRDLQRIIKGESIEANMAADRAYGQYMLDYLNNNEEYLNTQQKEDVANYIESLKDIIIKNTARNMLNAPMEEEAAQAKLTKLEDNTVTPGGSNMQRFN